MGGRESRSATPGWTPWDAPNGFRIGALAGGLLASGLALLLGGFTVWALVAGAVIGAGIGYASGRRTDPRR